jgi:hypothetical protein
MGILVRQMTVIERRSEYPLVANGGSTHSSGECQVSLRSQNGLKKLFTRFRPTPLALNDCFMAA